MSNPDASADGLMSKHRLEALSDGVFAVVMTLLVLEIKPEIEPHATNEAMRHMLQGLVLPLLTYTLAFFLAGVFWNLHHRKFALLRHTNTLHTGLTLAFLFTVTLLPVSVSIYLKAKMNSLALVIYFGNFTLIALPLLASWLYAQRSGLVDPARPAAAQASLTGRIVAMTAIGIVATLASYFEKPLLFLLAAVILVIRLKQRFRPTP